MIIETNHQTSFMASSFLLRLVRLFYAKWFCAWLIGILVVMTFFLYTDTIRPWVQSFGTMSQLPEPEISIGDTHYYWKYSILDGQHFKHIPLNYFGPIFFFKLAQNNFDLLPVINFSILFFLLWSIGRNLQINSLLFGVFLLANPLIIFQFITLNKEMMIIFSMLFASIYCNTEKSHHLLLTLLMAFFSKPEFLAMITVFLFLRKFDYKWRLPIILITLLLISYFYSELPGMKGRTASLYRGSNSNGFGFSMYLNDLAIKYHLFPLVFIPRLLTSIFEGGASFLINKGFKFNQFYYFISGFFFFFAMTTALFKKRLKLTNDLVFLLTLYLIMAETVPFPYHRYVLPSYPLFLLLCFDPKEKILLEEPQTQNS